MSENSYPKYIADPVLVSFPENPKRMPWRLMEIKDTESGVTPTTVCFVDAEDTEITLRTLTGYPGLLSAARNAFICLANLHRQQAWDKIEFDDSIDEAVDVENALRHALQELKAVPEKSEEDQIIEAAAKACADSALASEYAGDFPEVFASHLRTAVAKIREAGLL
jgi:hypothetical protein